MKIDSKTRRTPGAPYPTKHSGDIVFVEYIGDVPHNVVTTDGGYDFNEIHGGRVVFHNNGGGFCQSHPEEGIPSFCEPSGTSYWAANCVVLTIWDKAAQTTRNATPEEIEACGSKRLVDLPSDPFDGADESEGGVRYCTICKEHFDEDNTCHHLFWGDGGLTGPGDSESGELPGEDCKASFLALCRRAGIVRRLRHGLVPCTLRNSQMHATGGLGPSYVYMRAGKYDLGNIARKLDQYDGDGSLRNGAGWILSLDEETLAANEQTKRWLDEEAATQDARRASGEAVYAVTDSYRYVTDEARSETEYGGYHWTNAYRSVRKSALLMPWADALAIAKVLRKRGWGEVSVIHVRKRPAKAKKTRAAA